MARIFFKMSSGDVFTLSNKVYGGDGPMFTRQDATVQLSLITEHLRYFSVDDGSALFTKHIASAIIVE